MGCGASLDRWEEEERRWLAGPDLVEARPPTPDPEMKKPSRPEHPPGPLVAKVTHMKMDTIVIRARRRKDAQRRQAARSAHRWSQQGARFDEQLPPGAAAADATAPAAPRPGADAAVLALSSPPARFDRTKWLLATLGGESPYLETAEACERRLAAQHIQRRWLHLQDARLRQSMRSLAAQVLGPGAPPATVIGDHDHHAGDRPLRLRSPFQGEQRRQQLEELGPPDEDADAADAAEASAMLEDGAALGAMFRGVALEDYGGGATGAAEAGELRFDKGETVWVLRAPLYGHWFGCTAAAAAAAAKLELDNETASSAPLGGTFPGDAVKIYDPVGLEPDSCYLLSVDRGLELGRCSLAQRRLAIRESVALEIRGGGHGCCYAAHPVGDLFASLNPHQTKALADPDEWAKRKRKQEQLQGGARAPIGKKWSVTPEGRAQTEAKLERSTSGLPEETVGDRLMTAFQAGWFQDAVSDGMDNGMAHTEWLSPALDLLSVNSGNIVMEWGYCVGHGVARTLAALEEARKVAGQQPDDRIQQLVAETDEIKLELADLKLKKEASISDGVGYALINDEAIAVAESLGNKFMEMHRLCLTPEAGKVWVVTPSGTIALARTGVEDAFSQAAELELRDSTAIAVEQARAQAEKAAYEAGFEVTKQRNLVGITVEEAKAHQHYDEVMANIHRQDSFEVVAQTLNRESVLSEERKVQSLQEVEDMKEAAMADAFDEKTAMLFAAEKRAIDHVVKSILGVLTAAVSKQQGYEDVRDQMSFEALAWEDRQVLKAKELQLVEIGEITRDQDSAVSMQERGFRRDAMSLGQIAELDAELENIQRKAAVELELGEAKRLEKVDAAAREREAVFRLLERARVKVEAEVAEAAFDVERALKEADRHYKHARADASAQCSEGMSVVERTGYDRMRAVSDKHTVHMRALREEADASIERAKVACIEAIATAGRKKQQKFESSASDLLRCLNGAVESSRAAEETSTVVVKEAEAFLEAKLPSVRKEARASYVQNSPLLEFAEADVSKLYEQMELFPDDSMDRILTVNTLYFFPDLLAGLKELRRVLKHNGRMVCVIKCDHVKNSIKEGGQVQREGADTAAQLPASTDLLLQALREAGFGAAVRVTGSVTEDKHTAAMSLAERIAMGRITQTQDEDLRCDPPGVAQWRQELKGLSIAELCRLARGEIVRGNPDAKIRSAQMENEPEEALRMLIINERISMAHESKESRKASDGVAWGGTQLSEEVRATEFVPRLSENMQRCTGCRRRVSGITELVWSTVFFPAGEKPGAKSCRNAAEGDLEGTEELMRLCAECHALKVTFGLERRALAQREEVEVASVARGLNDGTMLTTDAATGRMDYQILQCGALDQRNVAAQVLAEADLLTGHHGARRGEGERGEAALGKGREGKKIPKKYLVEAQWGSVLDGGS